MSKKHTPSHENANEEPQLIEKKICQELVSEPDYLDSLVPEDLRLMFHKLCQQQFELESENEELRLTQAELNAARMRYFNLYDMAPVGYCALNESKLIVDVNRTAVTLLGRPREALVLQSFAQFVYTEDRDTFLQCHQRLLLNHGPQMCQLRMVKGDGTFFWAELTTSYLGTGSNQEYQIVIADIADRIRAEEALRQSEHRAQEAKDMLKLVLDTIPVRLFWKDLNSIYLGCNSQFARDAGYEAPEELIGLDDFSMGWKAQAELHRLDDFAVMNSGKAKLNIEEIQTTHDGKQVWLSTSKVPLRDMDGKVIGMLGVSEDISQRKSMEEDLHRAKKLESLSALTGGIVHDFNNILMVIAGNVSLAKTLLSPTDSAFERLAIAESSALKARDLSRQLLAFTHDSSLVKKSISAAEMMKTCCRLTLSGTKSTCSYGIPENLWSIEADEGQLGQALANILMKAHQDVQEGSEIRIECQNILGSSTNQVDLSKFCIGAASR